MIESIGKTSLGERVNAGLASKWRIVLSILVLFILSMIGILVFDAARESKRNDSSELAEDIQKLYNEWTQADPESKSDDKIMELIHRALTEYPRYFVAQKALYIRGRMNYERQNWVEAVESFRELIARWERSYLAPAALFNAASAKEQMDDMEGAKQYWAELHDRYEAVSPYSPEALFNLGRIAESESDAETALRHYRKIVARYPESRWSNISQNRVIAIENG